MVERAYVQSVCCSACSGAHPYQYLLPELITAPCTTSTLLKRRCSRVPDCLCSVRSATCATLCLQERRTVAGSTNATIFACMRRAMKSTPRRTSLCHHRHVVASHKQLSFERNVSGNAIWAHLSWEHLRGRTAPRCGHQIGSPPSDLHDCPP